MGFVEQVPVQPETAARFPDLHPAFDKQAAIPEANRCLFCFDAPCTSACPTHIDVPRFIKKIASGNLAGSARTILDANILGASCSRACPVEVLCEGACVLHRYNKQPIEIGRLQRFAMDAFHASGAPLPFTPAPTRATRVALIGAGPASLACAAELRRRGIRATIYDARPLPGGLNTYGIAEYKLPLAESLREIDMLAQLGVEFHFEHHDRRRHARRARTHPRRHLPRHRPGRNPPARHRRRRTARRHQRARSHRRLQVRRAHHARRPASPSSAQATPPSTPPSPPSASARPTSTWSIAAARSRCPPSRFEYEHARQEGVQFLWHVQPTRIHGDAAVERLN